MTKRNYQRELEQIIESWKGKEKVPSLLIHSCCAPCSSYVLEYLSLYFHITVLYYNPNIYPPEEFDKRAEEQRILIDRMQFQYPVKLMVSAYDEERFYRVVKGFEQAEEGGERCVRCYRLRLEEAARAAKEHGFQYFTTTLSISPLKKAEKLNEIGEELASKYGISYLVSDFKKKNGYRRSTELSKEFDLYRQDYCGCVFSKNERENLAIKQAK